MLEIRYVTGDATRPEGDGFKFIVHIVNDANMWGAGFVLALSKRWPWLKPDYHSWMSKQPKPVLGHVYSVKVETDVTIIHLIGQHGVRHVGGAPPVRYDAIARGFACIEDMMWGGRVSIHAPRLGCGLAGGEWSKVEPLLQQHFIDAGIPVTIYDLPERV